MEFAEYPSPAGRLRLAWQDERLCLCDWIDGSHHAANLRRLGRVSRRADFSLPDSEWEVAFSGWGQTKVRPPSEQLDEYFSGHRTAFSLPLLIIGTPFQRQVWQALLEIPYGETRTYQQIAARIGRPSAVRAVANAVGSNPISIIIPCHRVIGSDGSLTGYAGGLEAKRKLLQIERSKVTPNKEK